MLRLERGMYGTVVVSRQSSSEVSGCGNWFKSGLSEMGLDWEREVWWASTLAPTSMALLRIEEGETSGRW